MNIKGYEVHDGVLDLSGTGLTSIENKAFFFEKGIRAVILPSSIEYVGDWAFAKCPNLERVTFPCAHHSGMFGRDVFGGCGRLSLIEFEDMDESAARLLALCANRLSFDQLIRSDDLGSKSWYEKWDICLATRLKSDDAEAKMSAALCGEEDISYDGIGSVDGEMSGETGDFVLKEEYNRCALCYLRLSNDRYLSDNTRNIIEGYLIANRFGAGSEGSFYSIFEECGSDLSFLRIYLDTIKPNRDTLQDMIKTLETKDVYAKSYLIEESNGLGSIDDLML